MKSAVLELCSLIGVPQEIIDSSRRADPACGRPVEMAEVPIETIDAWLERQARGGGNWPAGQPADEYLKGIYQYNRFKQKLPICVEID